MTVFRNVGVCVNLDVFPPAQIAANLAEIGVSVARTAFGSATMVGNIIALVAAGKAIGHPIRMCLLVTAYRNDPVTWTQQQAFLLALRDGGATADCFVEGPNEMDNYSVGQGTHDVNGTNDCTGVPTAANFRAWAAAYGPWCRANLPGCTVIGPTVIGFNANDYASNAAAIGDVVDRGSFHNYPSNGGQADNLTGSGDGVDNIGDLDSVYHWAAAIMMGNRLGPMALTETGASASATPGGGVLDLPTQRSVCGNLLFDGLTRDFEPLVFYREQDTQATGGTEANFGLRNFDGSLKLWGAYLKRVAAYLADTTGIMQGAGDFTIAGTDATAGAAPALVMPTADGGSKTAMWHEPRVWNGTSFVVPPTQARTMTWPAACAWQIYDPALDQVVASGTGAAVSFALPEYPLILTRHPPAAAVPILTIGADMSTITFSTDLKAGTYTLATAGVAPTAASVPLVLNLAQDAYQGDAVAAITLDGMALPNVTVTAAHAAKAVQAVALGTVDPGKPHTLTVTFTNDAWGGSLALDRNLYVVSYQLGTAPAVACAAALMSTADTTKITIPAAS